MAERSSELLSALAGGMKYFYETVFLAKHISLSFIFFIFIFLKHISLSFK